MTDLPNPSDRRRIEQPFYALTWEQAKRDYEDGLLTPRGLIYCFFAIHLKPGAEQLVDVEHLCQLLQIHEATYYRAIGALKACGRLTVRRGKMRVSVPEIPALQSFSQMSDSDSQICDLNSQVSESELEVKALQGKPSRSSANVPKTKQTFKDKQTLVPVPHPVERIDRKGLGTSAEDPGDDGLEGLLHLIQSSGIRTNKTITETLARLHSQQGAAARQAVENALSALTEQQKRGRVRNPGGFLIAALRGSYTANQAKRQAKGRHAPQPPDEYQIVAAINGAIATGDRTFALAKLQALWAEGWHDEVEEWCIVWKRHWGFCITAEGVQDVAGDPPHP
ncbi:MAG TPA: hypothetical protein V6D29_05675 [Leptolyngbyaceae cyanobacterium]